MKLIIQIPCFNEADSLPVTLEALPSSLPGIDKIEILVIDDGSSDATEEVAYANGASYVVRHPQNRGLAAAFTTGIQACLERGADIIVNTDADNQYCADDMHLLVEPILAGRAEIVIGARPIREIEHFSPVKKLLQRFGSWIVRQASGLAVDDAPSGYRALTADAASRINVFTSYTYTLETIIQAGQLGLAVESVPVRVNADLRESRLVKSIARYVMRSMVTILRIAVIYRPLPFFLTIGAAMLGVGGLIGLRFVVMFLIGQGQGMVQSLILAAVLLLGGVQAVLFGVLADLISSNRKLLQDLKVQTRRAASQAGRDAGDP